MNKTRKENAGNLFITYSELSTADTGTSRRWFMKRDGTEKMVETEYTKAKKVDSFKRVKSLQRAKDIMLSHNPSNIVYGLFKRYDGTNINIYIKSDKAGIVSTHIATVGGK